MEKSELVSRLASSQNRRDEGPNQLLAQKIVDGNDERAITLLMGQLTSGSAIIKKDCIKVAYEIGERRPEMIANHAMTFINLLDSKDNRLQWGAMTALDCIVPINPELIFKNLTKILDTAEKGSVITKDHAIEILVKLGRISKYNEYVVPILVEVLAKAAANQFPKYAERIFSVINKSCRSAFEKILIDVVQELDTDSKRNRINKILKKLN